MFDNYVLSEGTVKNVTDSEGKVTGFSMKTRVNYYRGIPLSMIHDLDVELDGEAVEKKTCCLPLTILIISIRWSLKP